MRRGFEAQKKQRKLIRILTMPARFLRRLQDLYVQSVTEVSRVTPSGRVSVLRRSFSDVSTGPGDRDGEDYRELVRAASVRSLGRRDDESETETTTTTEVNRSKGLRKSGSAVVMQRIDEEKSLEVGDSAEDWIVKKKKKVV